MKKLMKQTLAVLTAVLLVFGSAPLAALEGLDFSVLDNIFSFRAEAASYSGTCGENLNWTLDTETGELVISGTGDMTSSSWDSHSSSIKKVTIGNSVTSIGTYAFFDCNSLTSVTIPDSVTSIGNYAFYNCDGLTSVTIGNSVTSIGDYAFKNCDSLTSITIPNSVTSIGNYAFEDCDSLTSVTIGNSVTSIGGSAFYDCDSLTSVTIGNSVTSIGDYAFSDCDSLTSVTVNSNNQYYSSDNYGVLFNKNKTELIQYPIGNKRTSYSIPNSVTSIGKYAFRYCDSLTSITIPNSVTSIGKYAFRYCDSLTDVYYVGTQEKWNKISIDDGNEDLTDAEIHFNSSGEHSHNYIPDVTKEATCEETGIMTYTCECGDSYTEVIPKKGHSYTSVVTAPTCTEKGYTTHTCECGDSYTDSYVNSTGHSYNAVVTAPTCTKRGYTTYTCKCGDSYVDNYVNASDHSYTSAVTTPATCKNSGVITYTCSECGDSYTETIPKTDHSYEAVVTAPTCTEIGYTTYTCECGDSYVDDYVDTLGHTDGEWVVTNPATMTETGIKTLYCSVCGAEIDTETIPVVKGKVNSVSVSDITLNYKKSAKLNPQIDADEGLEYTVEYKSSNTKIATVDNNGNVTAKGRGDVTITVTVTDSNGNTVTDTCKVTVKYTWWQWILVIVLFGWIWY